MFRRLKIFLIYAFIFLALTAGCAPEIYVSKPITTHEFKSNGIKLLWSKNNVYAPQDDFQPMMSSSSGLVCILGDIVYPPEKVVSCLESSNGSTLWQKGVGSPSGIIVNDDGIYVTHTGITGIEKYDQTGKIIWSNSFLDTGVKYLYLYRNQVQLLTQGTLTLDKETGKLINKNDKEIIFSTETERFIETYTLESRSSDLKTINWQLDNHHVYIELAPVFTDSLIFIRTDRVLGELLTIDRKTGKAIWQTDSNIISDIAYLPKKESVFVLTRNGKLLQINDKSGEQNVLVEFSNPPFWLNGDEQVGGYEIAVDETQNILFVLLGDSRQLFAFQLN